MGSSEILHILKIGFTHAIGKMSPTPKETPTVYGAKSIREIKNDGQVSTGRVTPAQSPERGSDEWNSLK